MEHADHDLVNAKKGIALHNPQNFLEHRKIIDSIVVGGAESLNTNTAQAHADTSMAFSIKGKTKELTRMFLAGSIGGGVGFAVVDTFLIQKFATTLSPNAKDGIEAGIGFAITIAGAGMNKLWLAELGSGYLAVPIARLTQRNLLGMATGAVKYAPPAGTYPITTNGRTGAVTTTVAGVKTF